MFFGKETVLPAARTAKEFDGLLKKEGTHIVLLNTHIAQLKSMIQLAKSENKKVILHADLVQGLAHDEYAAQFLCQHIKPYGLISTRKQMLITAKKHKVLAMQRLFLLDSLALDTSFRLIDDVKPDIIEVLPGVIPGMITEVLERSGIPVVAGGLIRSREEVNSALQAGATAVTTNRKELWNPDL
ncbi:glycerol-3-phosphate responsive antiterminator [Sinobaca sp. H24]|uniref:glycerol-3-phosphate responsive antiterminator n=1 Tax=Sinobaca sp. H24 TaxID=2923376 RepID=UPI00207A565B|nr:glycerol-3-phosphate responsive antiterminator [Sinobaca sp. H24]